VQQPAPLQEPTPVPEEPPAPDIPQAREEVPVEPEPQVPAVPQMTLEESDEPLRDSLAPLIDSSLLASALDADDLLERGVAVIDALSRGDIRHKLLPLSPPQGKFLVLKEGSQEIVDPAGYRRYDAYAQAIESLDTDALVEVFDRFRPLLEEAYGLLGYEAEAMDNALIRGLDRIIDAPVVEGRIEVRKVEAVYKYEDPNLEQLPKLHKQLLRMGPTNTRRVQAQAEALRQALLAR
jgi:hypothetical protein